jgi:hypothetical protein
MKEVEVERIDYQGATLEENTGKLTWKLKIKPSENLKIGFKYLVKYPKNQNILIE